MKRNTRITLLIWAVPGILFLGWGFFEWRKSQLDENERKVERAIKSLASAEADFRANDRDWNHINDFWTGDVAGLFYVRPNNGEGGPEVALIPRELAEADAAPLKPLCPKPVPYHGYFFVILEEDETLKGSPEQFYRQDTLGEPRMGKVHNTSKFGFCAYPAEYGVTGKFTFIINENNTVFRLDNGGKPMRVWPDDSPRRNTDWDGHYQKMD